MSSSRLPCKVLSEIKGKTLLYYLINRLKASNHNRICIATSKEFIDDRIDRFCMDNDIECFRGSLENVAKRMLSAAIYLEADAFVRINGDSPFIDPALINKGLKIYKDGEYDLVTNIFPRTFPVGQSVEIINTNSFKKAYSKMSQHDDFEHVTKYYYEHPSEFRIKNFRNNRDLSKYRLVVDTPEDLNRIENIIGSMSKPYTEYNFDELLKLYPVTKNKPC